MEMEMFDPEEEEKLEPPAVLLGTCAWLARKYGWNVHKIRLAMAFVAVLDPVCLVGFAYVITGIIAGDGLPD